MPKEDDAYGVSGGPFQAQIMCTVTSSSGPGVLHGSWVKIGLGATLDMLGLECRKQKHMSDRVCLSWG